MIKQLQGRHKLSQPKPLSFENLFEKDKEGIGKISSAERFPRNLHAFFKKESLCLIRIQNSFY